ncbi:hypothetical protein STZ1_21033 [Bacillus subtilis]
MVKGLLLLISLREKGFGAYNEFERNDHNGKCSIPSYHTKPFSRSR